MQPIAPSIAVNQLALPAQVGDVVQAHVDPTGHLVLQFVDGHVELKDLSEEKTRDLMMAVVGRCRAQIQELNQHAKTQVREPRKIALKCH